MKVKIYNRRGQWVGDYDTITKTYTTQRDYLKGQIFRHPKYKNAVGLDKAILKKLEAYGCEKIRVLIINLKKHSFYKEIGLKEFIEKSKDFCADKYAEKRNLTFYSSQKILPLNQFYDFKQVDLKKIFKN